MTAQRWWNGPPEPEGHPRSGLVPGAQGNAIGVFALVISIIGALSPKPLGILICVFGLILGGIAQARVEKGQATGKGLGTAAIIVSVVGIVLPIVWIASLSQ